MGKKHNQTKTRVWHVDDQFGTLKDGGHWISRRVAAELVKSGDALWKCSTDQTAGVIINKPLGTHNELIPYVHSSFTACDICGFNRCIEKAHIIPACMGGSEAAENLLGLCPNCHTLFDRFLLSVEEMVKIWPNVKRQLQWSKSDPRVSIWREAIMNTYGGRL
jgi:HNH endonuclease